jgi:hypothetical protein
MTDTNEPMSDEQIDTVLEAARLNGRGCVCHAYGAHECACGAVWLDSFATGVIRAITQLRAENAELRKIVDRLPATADGVPITPRSQCYFSSGVEAAVLAVWFCGTLSLQSHDERTGLPTNDWTLLSTTAERHNCYSTREAAEAALAERGEGTND